MVGKRQQTAVIVFGQEAQSPAGTGEDRKTQGWTLKSMKKPSRMTDKTKTYLMNIFEHGSQIGHKADPVQVSRQMKLEKDVDGKLLLSQMNGGHPNRSASCSPV